MPLQYRHDYRWTREDVRQIETMDGEGPTPIPSERFEREALEIEESESVTISASGGR